jgi:hypothetical protein
MGGRILAELIAFMLAAEIVGIDCSLVQGGSTAHYAAHWIAAIGLGVWCAFLARRLS